MSLNKFLVLLAACAVVCAIVCGCSFGTGSTQGGGTSAIGSYSSVLESSGPEVSASEDETSHSSTAGQPDGSEEGGTSSGDSQSGAEGDADDGEGENSSSDSSDDVEPPVELTVTVNDGVISWNNVAAEVYRVTVGDDSVTTVETEYEPVGLAAGVYAVRVVAYLRLDPAVTAEGEAELVIKGKAPILTVDGNTLIWTETDGAVSYKIYKETAFIAQTSANSFEVEPGIYTVVAVFEDQRLNSDKSNAVAVGAIELKAPVLTRDGDYINWTAVEGAVFYEIYVNGQHFQTVFGTGIRFSSLYEDVFKEDYPDGVSVEVVARGADGVVSSPSNQIIFS